MPRSPDGADLERWVVRLLKEMTRARGRRPIRLDAPRLAALLVVIAIVLVVGWAVRPRPRKAPAPPVAGEGYVLCSWNVENFFDDEDDPRNHDPLEDWFGRDPSAFALKVSLLADALLLQNGGRGPDVLAMVEVESLRGVEALRDALNARLPAPWHYSGIAFRANTTGRRFAPAVLSRIAVRDDLSRGGRDFGGRRILEAHLEAEGAPLVVLVGHWTSRLRGDTEAKRGAYADALYAGFLGPYREDSAADVFVCGDFNDEPDDTSVRDRLHGVGDPTLVREGDASPNLLDLVMGLDPARDGTYLYKGRWQFLDHILASPGLLDPRGWRVLPATIATAHDPSLRAGRAQAPRRFGAEGSANPRGPSDHFALTVQFRLAGARD